jgi:hypothetical protein
MDCQARLHGRWAGSVHGNGDANVFLQPGNRPTKDLYFLVHEGGGIEVKAGRAGLFLPEPFIENKSLIPFMESLKDFFSCGVQPFSDDQHFDGTFSEKSQ